MKDANPIEYAIVADTFPDIYLMHKYWSRKPADVVRGYIEHHTDPGDIVLDPFAGSGVVAIEAIRSGRKIVAVDINPVATFITRVTLRPVNLTDLSSSFEVVRSAVQSKINELYSTRCSACGNSAQGLVYRRFTEQGRRVYGAKSDESAIEYVCSCSRRHQRKHMDDEDRRLLSELDGLVIPYWYPGNVDIPPTRRGTSRKLAEFFTHRNLYALAMLYSAINKLPSGESKDALKLAFSASLAQSSEFTGVDQRGPGGWSPTAWIVPDLRVLRENVERNVWLNFENKFGAIWRGKRESNKVLFRYREAASFNELLNSDATALVLTGDATRLDCVPDSSVDYILTDPPYGGSLQYLPLSSIWAAWLGMNMDYRSEITIGAHQPDASVYRERLSNAFGQMAGKLRPLGRSDVFFRTSSPSEWTSLVQMAGESSLSIERIVYQSLRYSFSVGFRGRKTEQEDKQRVGAGASGDYIFSFRRIEQPGVLDEVDSKGLEKRIVEVACDVIRRRNEATPLVYILLTVFNDLGNEIAQSKLDPATVIQAQIGRQLFLSEANRGGATIARLWDRVELSKEEMLSLEGQPTLSSRVRETVISILSQREDAVLLHVLQGVLQRFTGPETVGARTVLSILEDCALEKVKGKTENSRRYVLKPDLAEQHLEHTRLVYLAAQLGRQHGFGVWVGKEHRQPFIYQGGLVDWDSIANLRTSDLQKSIRSVRDIQSADVIWSKEGHVIQLQICESGSIDPKSVDMLHELEKSCRSPRIIIVTPQRYYHELRPRSSSGRQPIPPNWSILLAHDLESLSGLRTYVPRPGHRHERIAQRVKATVEEKTLWCDGKLCRLVLNCPQLQQLVEPGQFFQILCNNGSGQLLSMYREASDYLNLRGRINTDPHALHTMRIPISVHRIYYDGFDPRSLGAPDPLPSEIRQALHGGLRTKMDIVFRVVGDGTEALAMKDKGDQIDLIGPLGNPADIDESIRSAILVAGGIGFAPLYPVAEKLRYWGRHVTLLLGARSTDDFLPEDVLRAEFGQMGVLLETAYETGTGEARLVTDLLPEKLKHYADADGAAVFMCGPWPMMKATARICADYGIRCYAFLEKRMYCGVGVCMSCVCQIKDSGDDQSAPSYYKRVCVDGPVFDARLVDWENEEFHVRKS